MTATDDLRRALDERGIEWYEDGEDTIIVDPDRPNWWLRVVAEWFGMGYEVRIRAWTRTVDEAIDALRLTGLREGWAALLPDRT